MDGAVVNPIPVSPARALGARVVIAVNLNADAFGRGTIIQEQGPEPDAAPTVDDRKGSPLRWLLRREVLRDPTSPRGIGSVMVDAFNITQDRIARSRLAGDPPDVMIAPRLGGIGVFEFHRAEEAIRLGAEATERALGELTEAVNALR
jgi:NTE family protein